MALKVTVLVEDSPADDPLLKNEHGISFLIEIDGHSILFDTGQSGAFIDNAELLGVDLLNLDYVVLSHGHYDHSGGFRALCEISSGFEFVTGSGFFTEKYSFHDRQHTFRGNNFNEEFLKKEEIPYRIVNTGITELLPGVFTVTNFIRTHTDEVSSSRYQLMEGTSFVKDPFTDEVLLALDTPKGLVVLAGCSHPGIRNMLDTAAARLRRPVYAVLGGTHLIEASEERIKSTVEYFSKSSMEYVGACHCTGEKAAARLESLGGRFLDIRPGSMFGV